ncbi:forespore capture DNA-binding protein RefZ [Brevibacillus panacihumi]|uniref:TetR/AcrR family transcriptional regulator n=1 Tax=Brevibacillus panacihumi TaxID=497735 RepID=A0A3M8CJB0_9BACL|nr:forespore capture DNA-binding protein RefZ [Brevibacillus panacihumi]RNB75638.1 TetR/AcrR family transcriptional regulator [Brevibacillus panacihumi]
MEQTKMRILSAAAKLFDIYGYHGTSVRKIAEEADVNVALISYHFQGKQGVLETLMASYFETLFRLVGEKEAALAGAAAWKKLAQIVRLYVQFHCEHAAITRLIQRELSVESMLAREVMTLYMSRYKHGLASVLEYGIGTGEFQTCSVDRVVLGVTSHIVYPLLHPQMVRQVYELEPASEEFVNWLYTSVLDFLRVSLIPDSGSSTLFHE